MDTEDNAQSQAGMQDEPANNPVNECSLNAFW